MRNNKPYLEAVELKEDRYCLNKGLRIEFQPITLLVGEQGCGKSTLLSLLQENSDIIEVHISDFVKMNGVDTFYFDSERMNPRIQSLDMFSNPDGTSRGIGLGSAMQSHFMSHGEVLKQFTVNRIKDAKDCVLFLDEPESALSLRNQYKLAGELKKAINNGVQVIVATHCLPVIESVENVYSLEHLQWMTSEEFINKNKNNE